MSTVTVTRTNHNSNRIDEDTRHESNSDNGRMVQD